MAEIWPVALGVGGVSGVVLLYGCLGLNMDGGVGVTCSVDGALVP